MLVCFTRESDSQAGKENKEYGDGRAGIYSHCAAAGGRWVPTFSLSVDVCVCLRGGLIWLENHIMIDALEI